METEGISTMALSAMLPFLEFVGVLRVLADKLVLLRS